jgi:hypothetical protein
VEADRLRGGKVRLPAGVSKNGEARTFPFTAEVRRILEAQHAQRLRLKQAGQITP